MENTRPDNQVISILYVDDESSVLDACKHYLERTGSFAVTTALSGSIALDLIRSRPFDIVVSDYQMADITGLDLLKIIRNEFPGQPFIIFTGKGREEVVIEAFENGTDFYVQKGGDPKVQYTDLMHKIRRAVGNRRMNERLQRSEEKFLSFVKNFDGIAFQMTVSGRFFLLEGTVEEMTGCKRQEFLSGAQTPEDLIHPEDRTHYMEIMAHLASEPGYHADTVFRILHRDGTVRWIHGILHTVTSHDNRILHIQGALYDITRLHAAQEDLAKNEEKWRSIITKAPVFITVLDREGTILFINKCRPYGKPAVQGLTGTRAADYFTPGREHLLANALNRVFATGEFMRFESSILLGDTITEWLSHQISPISWGDTRDAALMVSSVVTERKWLEQNLRESEEQYRAIVTASGDGILILDPGANVLFCSPRMYDIFEIPCEEPVAGRNALDYIDPAYHLIARSRIASILSGDLDAEPYEYILVSNRKNRFRGELVTTPLRDSNGAINRLLVLVRDISRRQSAPATPPPGLAGKFPVRE
ncbi:MAG: PAS domain S-box protein [Methanomicrobiales archaeon]|nr:PAS domain S-box protein [Methanomicrobiales archaeon]